MDYKTLDEFRFIFRDQVYRGMILNTGVKPNSLEESLIGDGLLEIILIEDSKGSEPQTYLITPERLTQLLESNLPAISARIQSDGEGVLGAKEA